MPVKDKATRCQYCGNPTPEDSWFCPACNSPLDREYDILEEEPPISEAADTPRKYSERNQQKDTTFMHEKNVNSLPGHEYFAKSWIIRIIISVIIIALLIGAILIISHVRKTSYPKKGGSWFIPVVTFSAQEKRENQACGYTLSFCQKLYCAIITEIHASFFQHDQVAMNNLPVDVKYSQS